MIYSMWYSVLQRWIYSRHAVLLLYVILIKFVVLGGVKCSYSVSIVLVF